MKLKDRPLVRPGQSVEHPFLARLARGPLLADGAMGTELLARGARLDQCLDAFNLDQPDIVQQIHREYLAAGAEMIETNTFGASRYRLEPLRPEGKVRAINPPGAPLAP